MSEEVNILCFESSCDDTSVALVQARRNELVPRVKGFAVQSQNDVHERFGGIVPELASRAHLKNLLPCLDKVLRESGVSLSQIDCFAATARPGLVGCLLVGHSAAKTLSMLFSKPLISCHHIEGHLLSIFLTEKPEFPFLTAVVSGGHTSLYRVHSYDSYDVLGVTLDDALGEAFDKGAKLLGLSFPGGPQLDLLAQRGDPTRFSFGKVKTEGFQFSFSGLKSEFHRLIQREGSRASKEDLAASYQLALLRHLVEKIAAAVHATQMKRLVIVGGVARNSELRRRLSELCSEGAIESWHSPALEYCTDNAAMIGVLAYRRYLKQDFDDLSAEVGATSRPQR